MQYITTSFVNVTVKCVTMMFNRTVKAKRKQFSDIWAKMIIYNSNRYPTTMTFDLLIEGNGTILLQMLL